MTLSTNEFKRLTELRTLELRGEATEADLSRLAVILQKLDEQEAIYPEPATEKLRQENAAKRADIAQLQAQNEALESIISEQEQLVADAKLFLTDLDKRHQRIHDSYAQLTGTPLAVDRATYNYRTAN